MKKKQLSKMRGTKATKRFFSIEEGNQTDLIFAPDYDPNWFEDLDAKYSWANYNRYDNRFYQYMERLFDTLPAMAKGKVKTNYEFFTMLTRVQKIFYTVLVFTGEVDNGGVYQFFFNRPEFSFAALEVLTELKFKRLRRDYEKCLMEFALAAGLIAKRKRSFNDIGKSKEIRWTSFSAGYEDIPSANVIQNYFYKETFKKGFHRKLVRFLDKNRNQLLKFPQKIG